MTSPDNSKTSEYRIIYRHTDIRLLCDREVKRDAEEFIAETYATLEAYVAKNPLFLVSYEPIEEDPNAPRIAREMIEAARTCGVGPMAAVAGAYAESLGGFLEEKGCGEYVIENGGDIYLKLKKPKTISIHAGPSKLSGRLGLRIEPGETPLAICTSSSSVGHSVSLGSSDAATAVAKSAYLADAAATAMGNSVKGTDGIKHALEKAKKIKGLRGAAIIKGEEIGLWGDLPQIIKTKKQIDKQ